MMPPTITIDNLKVQQFYNRLAEKLAGYEKRPEQYELTVTIANSIKAGQHLVAQAPTGTGKSFAVALGILSVLDGTKKRAVISTANNNLLEQYAKKDFPFLESLFPGLNWARYKGKQNYACIEKGEKLFGQGVLFGREERLEPLRQWYFDTQDGDKESISFTVKADDWQKLNVDDTCTGRKCPFYEDCHYYRAKEKAKNAQIVLTNFDLVLIDLFNPDAQIMPGYDVLVVDEAHELQDKAISKLEKSVSKKSVIALINRAIKNFEIVDPDFVAKVTSRVEGFFMLCENTLGEYETQKAIHPTETIEEYAKNAKAQLKELAARIAMFPPRKAKDEALQRNSLNKIDEILLAIHYFLNQQNGHVSWIEVTKDRKDSKIVSAPFRATKYLKEAMFDRDDLSVILLSATLGQMTPQKPVLMPDGSMVKSGVMFEWFRRVNGIAKAGEFNCKSPFDYRKNCIIYTPTPPDDRTKDPKNQEWLYWAQNEAINLIEMSQGKAFVLCTSVSNMNKFAEAIARSTSYKVMMQGNKTNSQLIEWFKNTPNSVLVATASFWQGVSIEGDDLKLVIIDKIPFPAHGDPVHEALGKWYEANPERKKRKFLEMSINPAIIMMAQGFGRLIRTKTDTGCVAILDPRVQTMWYGRKIMQALPNASQTTSITDPRLKALLGSGGTNA